MLKKFSMIILLALCATEAVCVTREARELSEEIGVLQETIIDYRTRPLDALIYLSKHWDLMEIIKKMEAEAQSSNSMLEMLVEFDGSIAVMKKRVKQVAELQKAIAQRKNIGPAYESFLRAYIPLVLGSMQLFVNRNFTYVQSGNPMAEMFEQYAPGAMQKSKQWKNAAKFALEKNPKGLMQITRRLGQELGRWSSQGSDREPRIYTLREGVDPDALQAEGNVQY